MTQAILTGDVREALKGLPDNCIDALCTDPPYGLNAPPDVLSTLAGWLFWGESKRARGRGFMGAKWDAEVPPPVCWSEVFRVMKPGAYGVVFAGARTVDLMGLSLRIAGFEIRDGLQWLYGEGYPSGNRKHSEIPGLGTRLMPGQEPIILIRKPIDAKTVEANFTKHGVGFLNIDAARVPMDPDDYEKHAKAIEAVRSKGGVRGGSWANDSDLSGANPANPLGRWPKNAVLDLYAGQVMDDQTGERRGMNGGGRHAEHVLIYHDPSDSYAWVTLSELDQLCKSVPGDVTDVTDSREHNEEAATRDLERPDRGMFGGPDSTHTSRGDTGGASRFFYCAKAKRDEKDAGLDHLEDKSGAELTGRKDGQAGLKNASAGAGRTSGGKNPHPTVKPVELMRWLVRMLCPSQGMTVLDPFAGSGSTGIAAMLEGHDFLGVELDETFAEIARDRIAHWRDENE